MKQYLLLMSMIALPVCVQAKGDFQPRSSLCFLENKGQITDQNHHPRTDIQYKIDGGGMSVFIGNGQLHYQFYKPERTDTTAYIAPLLKQQPTVDKPVPVDMYRMDVTLVGANPHATAEATEPVSFYERYHTTLLKDVTVHSYRKITYKDIYPNIDWVLYIKDNQLEYDFVVHPGGKVSDIQLKYGGATGLKQNSDGSITATTPMGTIGEAKPFGYEQESKQRVTSKFVMKQNTLHFTVAPYTGTLMIDPVLKWGTYYNCGDGAYGSGGNEQPITCNSTGDILLTGITNFANNIATAGAWQTTFADSTDMLLAKFDSSGNRLWATYFGGTGLEQSCRICCDANNNIYIGAATTSDGLATNGTWQTSRSGGYDAVLAKFDNSGALQWCTYYGGTATEFCTGLACDNAGHVYMTGYTASTSQIATTGAWQTSYGGGNAGNNFDAYLTQFNSNNGTINWGTYFGGNSRDESTAITYDPTGHIYITGYTASTNQIASTGAWQTTYGGGAYDAFLTQFNTSGDLLWSTYYGGSNEDDAYCVTSDQTGNVYITGYAGSTNNIASQGSYISNHTTYTNGYLAKFNSTGQRLWGTYVWGQKYYTVAIDMSNNVWLGGFTTTAIPNAVTAGAWQTTYGGGIYDAFLSKFTSTGNYLSGTYYGGSDAEVISNISIYNSDIYVSGWTYSTNQIATTGAFESTISPSGTSPIFLSLFVPDSFYIPMPVMDTTFCSGDTLHLPYYSNFSFQLPNTFTGLLSDSSGSFVHATTIGTRIDNTSDTITCIIPNTIATGHYKILVTANNLADTTMDTLNVFITSTAQLHPVANSPLCPGDTLKLTADTVQGSYKWTGPNNFTSSLQNPSIANVGVVNAGIYIVTDSLNGCRSLPDSVTVTLNSATAVTMYITVYPTTYVQGQNVTFTAHTAPAIAGLSYQWYLNGQPIQGATDTSYSSAALNMGDYVYLVVQSSGGNCISPHTITSNTIAVSVPNVVNSSDALTIYPNPGDGTFVLKGSVHSLNKGQLPVTITNTLGQVVYSGTIAVHNGKVEQQFNLKLLSGFYQIKVADTVIKMDITN